MKVNHSVKRALPNFFTFGSMMCGFLSVVYAVHQRFELAAWLIIIAAVADALDGIMARLTKTTSQFGVELDSICDVVSFGLAPAFVLLAYNAPSPNDLLGASPILIGAVLLYLFAGGFRLARFNAELQGFGKEHFKGLPIPSAAITIASFLLFVQDSPVFTSEKILTVSIVLALGLAYLMASKIKYDTLPKPSKSGLKENPFTVILLLISIAAAVATNGRALFYIFLFFILYGILRAVLKFFKKFSK